MAKRKNSKQVLSVANDAEVLTIQNTARNTLLDNFYHWENEVLVLNILGKPSAKQDAIGKPYGNQLKVSVRAAPEDGKATDYMVRFLAGVFDVSIKDIVVVFGQTSIHKQLRISAPKQLPTVIKRA